MLERLEAKLSDLRRIGVSNDICDHLADYIATSPPPRLHLISPFRLADAWALERDAVLDAFLYGTRIGIFDLEWDIKCPSCKGPTQMANSLVELKSASHCEKCKIDISAGFDDAVEVTFQVTPNIRDTGSISRGDVMMSWMQIEKVTALSVRPGQWVEIKLALEPGFYAMADPSLNITCPLVVTDEPVDAERTIEYFYDGQSLEKDDKWHGAGPFRIRLLNNGPEKMEFCFGRSVDFPWVSGARVASNQIFRDYFSSELISPDEYFAIRNVVFFFTDIKGSTDLYERRGDSKAYYLVREHFKIMTSMVKRNHGAVVKTIGDAVMATFLVSEDAINTVFEMHRSFEEFNTKEGALDQIIIKVGLHRGPCIAVTSNEALDYFGRTVNIAARIQGLSSGDDIMISKALYDETGIQALIDSFGWKTTPIQASLKGVESAYDVVHITNLDPTFKNVGGRISA